MKSKNKFNMNYYFSKYFSVIHAISILVGNQLTENKHYRVSQLLVQLKHASKVINTESHITLNLLPVYRYGHPFSIDTKISTNH